MALAYTTEQDLADRFSATEMAQVGDVHVTSAGHTDGGLLTEILAGKTDGQLLAENYTQAEIDAGRAAKTKMTRALTDAEGLANSYILERYALPLATVPDVLKGVVCDLARFGLWDDRASEEVTKRADLARAWLKDVAAGRASLGIVETSGAATTVTANKTEDDRVFTAATLAVGPGFEGGFVG